MSEIEYGKEATEVNQQFAALLSNSNAIRAVTEVVQGTLGPKGLDCMLLDSLGGLIVTNDGVTILRAMDVTHPAARILISVAEQQEEQVGDGTTTATIIAGTLIAEGVNRIMKGVPVIKVIEGIKVGIGHALSYLLEMVTPLDDLDSPILKNVSLVAARGNQDLANLIIKAAKTIGAKKLTEEGFKLSDQIMALEGSNSVLIEGTIIDKEPLNEEMPRQITGVKLIILDDALEPLKIDNEALGTEVGFHHHLFQEQELITNIQKLADLGVKAVFADRAICDAAEEKLTDLGIIGVQGVAAYEWRRLARMTGARPIKKGSLAKSREELQRVIGEAAEIVVDEQYKQLKIYAEPNQNFVTMIVGALTKEVIGERERIAKDAASAVQAAWRGGIVAGGGCAELAVARKLGECPVRDMNNYGYQCVIEALKRPMTQISINAGFNPLEKIEMVLGIQAEQDSNSIGVNCDTGVVEDLTKIGIWDPYLVKDYAIRSAGEVAEAILRINTMIKMKQEQ